MENESYTGYSQMELQTDKHGIPIAIKVTFQCTCNISELQLGLLDTNKDLKFVAGNIEITDDVTTITYTYADSIGLREFIEESKISDKIEQDKETFIQLVNQHYEQVVLNLDNLQSKLSNIKESIGNSFEF